MAFGFRREAGKGRGYVNEGNADFAPGQRLSRRQYDNYIEGIGKRQHLPGTEAIRATERQLEQLRENLRQREQNLNTREASLKLREQELELEKLLFRTGRTSAGQRRYNAVLDAYVTEQRRQGRKVTKIEARKSDAFKSILNDIKGRPNKRHNPNIAADNKQRRLRALERIGGGAAFREYYERMYGPTTGTRTLRGATKRNSARGRR